MAGRRLVDVAKLFNASRSVAQKHVALRSSQWETYNKTSSLAKAVKNQTDRVTLTVAAAIALSQRFSEEAPSYARAAAERATGASAPPPPPPPPSYSAGSAPPTSPQHDTIPRRETVDAHVPVNSVEEGLQQDHHYERSEQNSASTPPPEEELEIEQKDAPRRPLPDGTIPTSGLTLENEQEKGQDTFSERPVPEAPKHPLAEDQDEQINNRDEGLKPVESDESTIPVPGRPSGTTLQSPEAIPSHAQDVQKTSAPPQIRKLQEVHDRDASYARSAGSKPAAPWEPRSQIPSHTETAQESDKHVKDAGLNKDVFHSTPKAGHTHAKVEEQEDIPEGINTDVFHSKRVARMLGSDPFSRKEHVERKSSGRHPLDDRPIPQANTSKRHPLDNRPLPQNTSQPSPNVKIEGHSQPSAQPTTSKDEMEKLAAQLAQDAQVNAATAKVRI